MEQRRRVLALSALLLSCVGLAVGQTGVEGANASELFYVGTETKTESGAKGIYAFRLDVATGMVEPLGLAAETPTPASLALRPPGRFLYTGNEISNYGAAKSGSVSAFRIDQGTGMLTFLNTVSSGGAKASHLSAASSGRHILVANVLGGSVAVLPVKDDGSLGEASAFIQHRGSGPNPKRQEGPHAHAIVPSPDDRFALVCDLGLDKVFVYRFDAAAGSLTPNEPPFAEVKPGGGPRHLAFHPSGRFVYLVNEMHSSLTVFSYDSRRGVLKESQTVSTLPREFRGENRGAEVQVHPTGRFVYASNRGNDSIAVFAVDPQNGTLRPVDYALAHGKEPRTFAIDVTGLYLLAANRQSDTITVFKIDANTGRLNFTDETIQIQVPVSILFMPGGELNGGARRP
jgi:6-phosphogluconolactonase